MFQWMQSPSYSNAYSIWHLHLQCISYGSSLMLQTSLKFVICQLLQDLQGVLNIADDILVFGRTREVFNSNVISFLDWCVKEDIHLNPDKVQINTDNIPFFGHVLTKDGIQPDESKVKLILDWPIPENQKELQQFHGFCQLFVKILSFSFRRVPLLQLLLKKDSEFIWTDTHTLAFNRIKEHVSNEVKLQFFDSSKLLFIEVNASKRGIGAAMLQCDPIVQKLIINWDS